jgi:hypothetical protein
VRTGGGCMGDGFHGWASAESIIMIRNLMVREVSLCDGSEALIWLSGYRDKWLRQTSSAENLCTPWSVAAFRLEKLRFRVQGLSTAVANIISLPEGYSAIDAANGNPLREITPDKICSAISTERSYFVLDNGDDAAEIELLPPAERR